MKRILSVVLSFIVIISMFSVPMHAANNQEYAEKLSVINVFKGTGNGYELDREPTRLEGLIMLIRLLGKEEAIESYTTDVFTDVPEWGSKYANYAYANGLTKGIGNGKFGSNDLMNAQSYLTFMLRALGYDDSKGEFNWSTAIDDAYRLNVIDNQVKNELKTNVFLRDHVAQSSYLTLQSAVKGSNIKLIDKLVSEGAISSEAAEKMLADNQNIFEGYTIIEVDGGNLSGHREANVAVDIGFGNRNYWAFTNQYGQLVRVIADEIVLQDESTEPVNASGRYYPDEAKVKGVESEYLDEGHVIADSLGGVANAYNITPQNSTLNRHGDQAYMEKVIRDAGGCSDFEAIITYENNETQIPSSYRYTYTIMGNIITDEFANVNPDEVNQAINNDTSETSNSQIEILELDKGAEFVDIINNGNTDVNIGGWTLVSEKGNQTFVFPSGYTLKAGQVSRLTSGDLKGTGDFTMADTTIWNNSDYDPAVLYDGNWNEIDREEGHK